MKQGASSRQLDDSTPSPEEIEKMKKYALAHIPEFDHDHLEKYTYEEDFDPSVLGDVMGDHGDRRRLGYTISEGLGGGWVMRYHYTSSGSYIASTLWFNGEYVDTLHLAFSSFK